MSCPFAGTSRDGSDGTRTRDLRRDRPVLVVPGWAAIGGDYRRARDFSPGGLRGLAGARRSFRRPPAGCTRDGCIASTVNKRDVSGNGLVRRRTLRAHDCLARRRRVPGPLRDRRARSSRSQSSRACRASGVAQSDPAPPVAAPAAPTARYDRQAGPRGRTAPTIRLHERALQ